MREVLSTILAFAVAPLLPALVISLMFFGPLESENLETFPFVYLITLVAALVFGLPAFVLGKSLDLIRWWSALIVGFLIGALLLTLFIGSIGGVWYQRDAFLLYAGSGAVGGFVFWLVWRLGHHT